MILEEPMNWWVSLLFILPMCIVAYVLHIKPPKKINTVYGYRTKRSMSSQEMWDEANRYFEKIFIYYLIFLVITAIFFSVLSWSLLLYTLSYICGLIVLIPITERHLINFEKRLKQNK